MPTIYAVLEIGYEYNDEIMARPEEESGLPKCSFSSLETALEKALILNAEEFRNNQFCLRDYCYDLEEVGNSTVIWKTLVETIGLYRAQLIFNLDSDINEPEKSDILDINFFETLTDKEIEKMMPLIDLVFYKVVPIELD